MVKRTVKSGPMLFVQKLEITKPSMLTLYILQDEKRFMAKCPELDLVTEMNTREKALDALLEIIMEYSEDYMKQYELFSRSPNRKYHRPYIAIIKNCKSKWELLELINVKYGHIQLQSVA